MKNPAKICLILSAAIIVIALCMTIMGSGLNLGNDFNGGFGNAALCIVLTLALVLVFLIIRFDFAGTMAAAVCVAHDVLLVFAFSVILRSLVVVNFPFVAVLLLCAAYSAFNVISLLNQAREQGRSAKDTPDTIATRAVQAARPRIFLFALTSLATLVLLCILGGNAVLSITLPLIIGVCASAYSSTMILGSVWTTLQGKKANA